MQILWILLWTLLGVVVAYFALLIIAAACVDTNKIYMHDSKFYRWIVKSVSFFVLAVPRVKLKVEGKELLPKERYLLVGNHRSNFDPIATWQALPEANLAFVSKPENFKIPIFGRLIRPCCFLPLDRENAKNAIQTINTAAELLKSGEVSIGIYPEGTRNKTDATLLPFHNGAFKIAQKANVPMAVVALKGTNEVYKRTPWRSTTVTLKVLEGIPKEEVKALRSAELGDRVEKLLRDYLESGK